ncbi:uncharacterized protein JCM6883_000991 [Sporobolomyces salmoneus]|uniref:uncharacterized protein n=1 Tax=Sporobolomyces salmoneus TaxID=183962 RepID=UPI003176A881
MANQRPLPPRRRTLVGDHPVCTSQSMDEAYASGDVIGTGSFGIIRKVTRRTDGRVLARKELNYGRMDERDLKQLTEEVNILEQLGSNDNIVRYYERFVDKPNNMLYILMEYCEGGDLAGVIQRCRKTGCLLPEDVVWAYLTQITLALHDCHSEMDLNGKRKPVILHRDIKPENVFLDKDNNLKLGDFGLSKAMQQAAMTQTYVGTPYYMSPELINGQPYDVKSDIWALGCLIYELCAGHPPFHEARTQPELAVMIREGKIPDLPKPYTAHLGQVVRAMLKQNPKHRPNTSQIKALDTVRLQVRALELRKATRELRLRDQLVAEREKDLLSREASVLQREQSVLARENSLRSLSDQLKDREQKVSEGERKLSEAIQTQRALAFADRENQRPHMHGYGSNGSPIVDQEVVARVASRPSLVPRRPLDERRASNASSNTFQILPFPRISSSSSLMSLDDTPIKTNSPSLRRRLASKSMHDLHGQSGTMTTPTRTVSISNDALRAVANRSPVTVAPPILSRPPSAPVPEQPSLQPHPAAHTRAYSNPNSPALLPPLPHSTSAPSTVDPSQLQTYRQQQQQQILFDDDVPSPFLKKPQSMPMSGRQNSTGGVAKSVKQPILSRLLASRAQQQQQSPQGGGGEQSTQRLEGIPRRISMARKSFGV